MPKIRKTPQAYIVEPTFGEQLAEVLPSILRSVVYAKQKMEEDRLRRLELRMKYASATPELQLLMISDTEFQKELTGKRKPVSADLPAIRDLTPDELQERRNRQLEEQKTSAEIKRLDQDTLRLQQDYELTKRKLTAWGKIDNIPPDQLTLLDFIEAGAGETPEERAQAFVSKKWPQYADQIAQMRAGAGPEIERARTNAAAQDIFEKVGKLGPDEMAYAEAVGKNDLAGIQKLADGRLKTLAFRQFEQQQKRDGEAVRRANEAHQEAIGSAAQRIIEQNPTIDLAMAQDMAKRLMNGKPLTSEQARASINWAALKAETALETSRKLAYEQGQERSGTTELKSLIDEHLKILSQEEGVDPDVKKWSGEQVKVLMPELAKRVAKQIGLPEPQTGQNPKDDKYWGYDPVMATIWGALGLGKSLISSTGGEAPVAPAPAGPEMKGPLKPGDLSLRSLIGAPDVERAIAISARDAIGALQNLGKTVSPGLEAALRAVDSLRKNAVMGDELISSTRPVEGAARKTGLSEEQKVHLQNLGLEAVKTTADPSVPLPVKVKMGELLDLLESVDKGERPFSDLLRFDATVTQ